MPLDFIIGGAEDGRPGLAHAGRAALGGPLHLAAVERHGRREGAACSPRARTRASAASSTCRSASSKASKPCIARMVGLHLHDGRGALGHRRRHRRRREAVGAFGDAEVSRHRDGPAGRERRHGRARRQGHPAWARATISAAATRSCPVAITVEGANILTRILIIFGQGAIRCHPFVLQGDERGAQSGSQAGRRRVRHARCSATSASPSRNAVRSFIMALTHARFTRVPDVGDTRRYYQHIVRFTRVVRVRGRRRDAHARRLSQEEGEPLRAPRRRALVHVPRLDGAQAPREPGPARRRTCRSSNGPAATSSTRAQEQLHDFLRNFPNRFLGWRDARADLPAAAAPIPRRATGSAARSPSRAEPHRSRATGCAASSTARSSPAIRSACCRKRWCCRRPPSPSRSASASRA